MSRLIDAESLEHKIVNHRRIAIHKDDIVTLIADSPTVDAVQVVRCKDCKFLRIDEAEILFCNNIFSPSHNRAVWYDDFCKYGERKTDNEKET